ncbi:DNA-binding protein WhiA [bacterium]|nr:DNA-binding protein WhiA [bacterium]
MSFTAEVKDELSRIVGDDDERVAELAALVRTSGTLAMSSHQSYRLSLATETGAVARAAILLFHQCFNLRTELTVRRSVLHRTRNYLVTVPEQPVMAESLVLMNVLNDDLGLARDVDPRLVATRATAVAYLRGAFMAGGSVADPRADAHLELVATSLPLSDGLAELLRRVGFPVRVSRRRGEFVLYLKSAAEISGLLRLLGATSSSDLIERARVVKSLRNETNRRVNAEFANQKKTTDAAGAQVEMIRAIERARGLESLPAALRDFCELRLEHPELSLRELGEAAQPPLSKSAVGHRLRRLEEIADQLGVAGDSRDPG